MNVKVWNHNIYPYSENFRDRMITIDANAFVEMDEDEADYFLQTFRFPTKDSQGRPDPKHFKKLKIEIPPELIQARADRDKFVNHANGQRSGSASELAEALKQFSHMQAEKDPDGELEAAKLKSKNLAKENKALKSRLDLIEEKLGLKEVATNEESV